MSEGNIHSAPCTINSNEGLVWGAAAAGRSNGTSGVLVYKIKEQKKSLDYLWNVPYERKNSLNSWSCEFML
ncbi:6853_t:CDS:1, partial [Racocetra fulgida]